MLVPKVRARCEPRRNGGAWPAHKSAPEHACIVRASVGPQSGEVGCLLPSSPPASRSEAGEHVLVVVIAVLALLALVVLAGFPPVWNLLAPRYDRRRREQDDDYLFHACASGVMFRYRRINRLIPADPRCRVCLLPFGGVGRILRIQPSRKDPNHCMACDEMAPLGASDMEVGVLFADIRGFTSWCEGRAPEEIESALNRFYVVSTSVLAESDAIIDKMVADEVMALFLPAWNYRLRAERFWMKNALNTSVAKGIALQTRYVAQN